VGAVQKLATTVIVGLVALATVLVVLLANEPNRRDDEEAEQEEVAITRAIETYIVNCVACHGPGGEGSSTPGEQGTGRIGAPLGGNTPQGQRVQALNQSTDPATREEREDVIRDALNYGRGQEPFSMPAWGIEGDNQLNQEQIEELVLMIQNVDWDRVYNEAVHELGGYPTVQPAPVAAAAGSGQAAAGQQQTVPGTPGAQGSPTAASPVAPPGPPTGGGPAQTLTAVNTSWDKTEFTIPANTDVPFALVNADPIEHNFTVEGTEIAEVMPGSQTVDATVNLPPGQYTFVCTVEGHEALMTGTLTVQ